MARPPGVIDRVNYVVDTWNNPCDAPWVVYAETALDASMSVAIAIVCFDIGDVLRFIFRPAATRSTGHLGRRKKGRHGRKPKGFRQRLAAKIPPFERLQQRSLSQGVRKLWVIDGIGQRLLWWWLMIDVASGFAYNFTSMLYKTERCQMASAPGAALREHTTEVHIALTGWDAVGYATFRYQRGSAATSPFSATVGPGFWSVVGSLDMKNETEDTLTAELRVKLITPGGTLLFPGGAVSIAPGQVGQVIAVAKQKGPFSSVIESRISAGNTRSSAGAMYVQGRPLVEDPPIRFTCDSPFFPS